MPASAPRAHILAFVVLTSTIPGSALAPPEIAPGTLVSILGTNLSTPPITAQYDAAGLYPKSLGDTTVTFNGIAAPLLYVSTTQVNAVVPFGVAGQKTVEVLLTHYEPAPPSSPHGTSREGRSKS